MATADINGGPIVTAQKRATESTTALGVPYKTLIHLGNVGNKSSGIQDSSQLLMVDPIKRLGLILKSCARIDRRLLHPRAYQMQVTVTCSSLHSLSVRILDRIFNFVFSRVMHLQSSKSHPPTFTYLNREMTPLQIRSGTGPCRNQVLNTTFKISTMIHRTYHQVAVA